ncbi:DeoR/GlpR family DNA-binding transcription regulator [Tomitella gaofuii]|uniref:DeoR/GlpR family DNA-binding transcription regulator n=1 Tax=Tomitella gaofuii TaxID=2760083 RepID=UPI0015FD3EBF|nr:DeoR/GlpR family DNA-binding transcription regulator [Tomitella gaofuii]
MYAEERQLAITTEVSQRARVSVAQLARRFDVTTETIRRDLAALDRAGTIRRVHGGAVPAGAFPRPEEALGTRLETMTEQKERIARAALAYLPPAGGSILLDAGTTTGALAAMLPRDLALSVITNSLPIATTIAGLPDAALHLLGGRVRGLTRAAVGPVALQSIDALLADVAFLGTNAVTADHGLSTPDPEEAAIKRAMVTHAGLVVALADSGKLGHDALVRFAETAEIDVLITDTGADPDETESLRGQGIEVVLA